MSDYSKGYEQGQRVGRETNAEAFRRRMDYDTRWIRELFPTMGEMELAGVVRDYDAERLACQPDYARLPELRGQADRNVGQRDGFRDATGLDATAVAFHFSFTHYWTRRLNSRHVARWDLVRLHSGGCTNVFIPDGVEGVTIGNNRDISLVPHDPRRFATWAPRDVFSSNEKELAWCQGAVSAAVLLDEEPRCIFPCDAHELLPDDCREDIRDIQEFMTRYSDFWGPCKQLWVDRQRRAVGVEKTNCRIGFIEPDGGTGAVAITACSYITPELARMRDERLARVAREKGETWENCLDRMYNHGADKRQHRLLELTFAEARRGATLWGTLNVVADHDAPYPQRVCLAGETVDPIRQPMPEWSVVQHAAVITGPNRRVLYRGIEDMARPRAVYQHTPKLRVADDVETQPAWQADLDAGRCKLADDEQDGWPSRHREAVVR